MRTNNNPRRLAVVAGALVAGLAITGVAVAQTGGDPAAASSSPAIADRATDKAPDVEQQQGIVLEGGAPGVAVTIYENSVHGNSISIVIGDPEDGGSAGFVEQSEPFVVDGVLSATVDVDGELATLSGSVVESGRPATIVEPLQDDGEQIVSKGTNTPLRADVVMSLDGTTIPLDVAPAFAYDLQVRRVALGGS